jgi:hypothetical protein
MKKILVVSNDNYFSYKLFNYKAIKNKCELSYALLHNSKQSHLFKKLNKNILVKDISNYNFLVNNKFPVKKKISKKYFNEASKKEFFDLLQYYEYNKEFSYKKKIFLFKKTVSIVIEFLDSIKFDAIFFSYIPHNILDLTLLNVCKKKNKKAIIIRGLPVPNYYFFSDSVYSVKFNEEKITNKKKDKTVTDIINNINKFNIYIKKKNIWQNHELIDVHKKSKLINLYELFFLIKRYFFYLMRLIYIYFSCLKNYIINKKKFDYYFYSGEIRDIRPSSKKFIKRINILEMEKIHFQNDIKKNNLIKYYMNLTLDVNLNESFVFFPMWFQPSSTTNPYAGQYKDVLKCIKIISRSLPSNINLYVRESADIFNISRHAWTRGTNVRSEVFYKKISKINNVKLINFDIPDKTLIIESLFVISMMDKIGLMALYNNKAIINFGNSIHNYFDQCYNFKNITKLKSDISIILKNKKKINTFKKKLKLIKNNFFYKDQILGKENFKIKRKANNNLIARNLLKLL